MVKQRIKAMLLEAAKAAYQAGDLASADFPDTVLEEPRAEQHGDLATNFAMAGASAQKMAPAKIARAVVNHLSDPEGLI
ncbi:MAG: arginine--tRNA ligase, partial [Desulfosalsimonas sp.]